MICDQRTEGLSEMISLVTTLMFGQAIFVRQEEVYCCNTSFSAALDSTGRSEILYILYNIYYNISLLPSTRKNGRLQRQVCDTCDDRQYVRQTVLDD